MIIFLKFLKDDLWNWGRLLRVGCRHCRILVKILKSDKFFNARHSDW
jgi:hypothetical protein